MRKSPASANVISAKARAMYGQCLKPQQFQELLACHSVGEVAAYLKNRTRYSGVLADISESSIHRGHLETLLRRKLYDDVAALGRYDEKVNMHATTYLVERQEVSLIMQCLRLLSAGMMDRFLFTMPLFFTEHASFDMLAMEKVRTPAALLDLLGHTPYYKILEPFLQDAQGPSAQGLPAQEPLPLTDIENALETHMVQTLLRIVSETTGELHKQMLSLAGAQIDAQNVCRILRMKTYFNATPDEIRAHLLPYGGNLTKKQMEALITAPSADAALALFYGTALGRQLPPEYRAYTHDLYHRIPYFDAVHKLHFSTHPLVVLFAFMLITEVEVEDIINIIEGIRYGQPPEVIRPLLIII